MRLFDNPAVEKSLFTAYSPILSKKLKEMRKAAGLTQRQLAKLLKTEQAIIVRLEQGQRRLDMIEFFLLCHALELDPRKVASELYTECLGAEASTQKDRRSKTR